MRRKNQPFFWFTLIVLAGVAALLTYGLRRQARQIVREFDAETIFRHYPDFAIGLPEGFAIHGIDVSRYQENINWPLVHKMRSSDVQLGFVIIKATEGVTLVDRQFLRNWRRSKQAGMVRGAYHFYRPGNTGKRQAEFFTRNVKLQKGDLPPVLDIEQAGNYDAETIASGAMEWLTAIEAHYGVRPIIYTNPGFYNKYLGAAFNDYPLWIAHYREKRAPRIGRPWIMWQHNESGRVNGIRAFVDFNVFNGDSADFKALLIP